MIPFGELAPDISDLNTSVANTANNVIAGINSYQPLPNLTAQSNALAGPCKGAVTMKDNSGNNYIYAGDSTALYGIVGVTVTDYSKVGGYTDNSERWSFVKWGNQVIASKYGDAPQVLTLSGTTFADLTGTPPQSKTMTIVRDFVVMGNTYDSSDGGRANRVWWSGFNDETEWTPGTNQSDYQDIQGNGGEVKRVVGGEYGIVFQENSIWRMTYVGTPTIFQFDEVEPGKGTVNGPSVVQYGSDIFYLAQDGFYVLRNGTTSEPIGVNKIDKYFYQNVNQSYLANVTAALDPANGLVMWSYPSMLSSDGTPDRVVIYNYKTGRWSTGDIAMQLLFTGGSSAYTLEDLDAFGTVDTITISFDSPAWKGGALKLAGFSTDNKLAFFTGAALDGSIETGEISTDGRLTMIKSVRPQIDGTCTVSLATRNLLSETPSSTIDVSVDATGKAPFRTNKRFHRVKVNTSGDFTQAVGVEVDTKPRGKR